LIDDMPEQHAIVVVRPAAALTARPRLFAALEGAFPVRFCTSPPEHGVAGVLVLAHESLPESGDLAQADVPTLALYGDAMLAGDPEEFRLQSTAAVDRRLRGIVLHDRLVGPALTTSRGEEVLAVANSGPVWSAGGGPAPVHRVRSSLPELEPDEPLYALLSRRALALVALIHFLRGLSAQDGRRPPPLRATIHFDDPNLRWRSYGFIDYRLLLEHADVHGYHCAMAMIPLDAGRADRTATALFSRRPDRLSLVFHGNDHVKGELMAPRDGTTARAVAAQALRRMERFERRSGLRVDRVMTPPHGMCSEPMARALGEVGFDALAAIYPLPWTDHYPGDPVLAGWWPAEWVAGCAVIPRIPLHSSPADIAMRAFLDHPIVLYGHHEDVAEGLEPLAEAAAAVNRLGDVHWTSMGEIALTNSESRIDGNRVVVRPFARRLRLPLDDGPSAVCIQAPSDAVRDGALEGWSCNGGPAQPFGTETSSPVNGPGDIRLRGAGDVLSSAVAAPNWRPWPKLRRAATEMRDRAMPLRP
jgi:hypothetical protein